MSRTPHSTADVRELTRLADLPTDDPLCRWAAQDLGAARAFTLGAAVAVASPDLSLHDRVAVAGPAHDLVPLVREVQREVGPGYRLLGDRPLIDELLPALPELRPTVGLGWMSRSVERKDPAAGLAGPRPAADEAGVGGLPADRSAVGEAGADGTGADSSAGGGTLARWLPPSAAADVAALLDTGFPDSYAYPGLPGARDRWAGVLQDDGKPAAVAALIWCAPSVGYIAGVATVPEARGRGLGRAVCAFVVAEALAEYGTAALLVDDRNPAALRLYRSLGMAYRPLRAATVEP